jgi:hypothetical protein
MLADTAKLHAAGVQGVMPFGEGVLYLLLGLNADQDASEMRFRWAENLTTYFRAKI